MKNRVAFGHPFLFKAQKFHRLFSAPVSHISPAGHKSYWGFLCTRNGRGQIPYRQSSFFKVTFVDFTAKFAWIHFGLSSPVVPAQNWSLPKSFRAGKFKNLFFAYFVIEHGKREHYDYHIYYPEKAEKNSGEEHSQKGKYRIFTVIVFINIRTPVKTTTYFSVTGDEAVKSAIGNQ